jgi:large subunit ribosomal protein L15
METMNLSNLKPRPGAKHRKKRLGCGESSGHGKTSGKGHKGQKARSGGSIRLGFEGGQMPLIRRIPKRGFNNVQFKKVWGAVNVGELEGYPAGTTIDEEFLRKEGFVRGKIDGIKILGEGALTKSLAIVAKKVSAGAKEKIEKAGGTVTLK